MQILWIISLLLLFIYCIQILAYRSGWLRLLLKKKATADVLPVSGLPQVSVIIPVRNEEENLGNLLEDLVAQDYPAGRFEIIIVDDHSSDGSPSLVGSFQAKHPHIRLLSLDPSENGKKDALRKGIEAADYPLILNSDGDCRASPGWIREMTAGFSNPGTRMVTGAVVFEPRKGLFHALQCLELFSHTAISAGSAGLGKPVLCTAANLAYYKDDYLEYISTQKRVSESGDDIFLMLWMKRQWTGSIRFNPSREAVIRTRTADTPGSFIRQRMRWTSKSRYYRDFHIISTALIVFGLNALLTLFFLGCLMVPWWSAEVALGLIPLFAGILIGKSMADFLLLQPVVRHYRSQFLLWYMLPMELIYFMYVSFTGIAGQVAGVNWKGRIINASGKGR